MYTYTEQTKDELRAEVERQRKELIELGDKYTAACRYSNQQTELIASDKQEISDLREEVQNLYARIEKLNSENDKLVSRRLEKSNALRIGLGQRDSIIGYLKRTSRELEGKLAKLHHFSNVMTSALSVVFDELERRGIADEVAASASSDKVDVSDLLRSHREWLAKNK